MCVDTRQYAATRFGRKSALLFPLYSGFAGITLTALGIVTACVDIFVFLLSDNISVFQKQAD